MRKIPVFLISAFIFIIARADLQIEGVKIQTSEETTIALYLPYGGFQLLDIAMGNISHDTFERIDRIGSAVISYDTLGRIEQIGSATVSYDTLGRIDSIGGRLISYDTLGRIDHIGNAAVVYDTLGRIEKIGGIQISYDLVGRIETIQGNAGPSLRILVRFSK